MTMPRHPDLITNGSFANGTTAWTLGSGYSVVPGVSPYLAWASGTDTTAETTQIIGLMPNTFYELSLEFQAELDDETIVLDAVASSALQNAQVTLTDNDTLSLLGTVYLGQSTGWVRRGTIFYSGNTRSCKIGLIGRRAGSAGFRKVMLTRLNMPRTTQRVTPQMAFPSFKGGNYREMESSAGTDIPVTWLSSGEFTSGNRAAWVSDFEDVYVRNRIKVVRLFINIGGDYASNLNLFSSDWSALNGTEKANLETFFEEDVPVGLAVRVVFSRHEGIPDSVINTSLSPANAHETRSKWLARLANVAEALSPYKAKIHSWEAVNEPNLNVGGDISWGHLQGFLATCYTTLKGVDPEIPVSVSHQNQLVYLYPELLLQDTADFYDMHWYANQPWKTTATATPLCILPEYLDKPSIIGEWGHTNYTVVSDNRSILEPSFNLFWRLGFEHVAPWSIKDTGDGSSQPVEARTYLTPDGLG